MSTPIHYLEILLFLAMLHPAGLGSTVVGAFVARARWAMLGKNVNVFLFVVEVLAYGLIVGLVLLIMPGLWRIRFAPWLLIVGAAGGGIVLFYLELLAALVLQRITVGVWAKKVVLRREWQIKNFSFIMLFSVVVGTWEEIVFRQLLITLVLSVFRFSYWSAIVLSAACFALNHLRFGFKTVIIKLLSGVVYASLFVFSDFSVVPSIVCHATQNIFTLALLHRGPYDD